MSNSTAVEILKAVGPAALGAFGFMFGPTLLKKAGSAGDVLENISYFSTIADCTEDLNKQAENNIISKVYKRTKEETRIISHLKGGKGIIFVTGGPGTGKTSLIKWIALRIFKKEIPGLENARILSVNMGKLFPSGMFAALTSTMDGGADDKIKKIAVSIKKAKVNNNEDLFVYFDEAHEVFEKAPEAFDKLLAQLGDNIHFIASTTHETVINDWLVKRPAMWRRSLTVQLRPMNPNSILEILEKSTLDILEGYLPGKGSSIQVEKGAMQACIMYASILHKNEHDPDRSLTLYQRFLGIYAGYIKGGSYISNNLSAKQFANFLDATENEDKLFSANQEYNKMTWESFSTTNAEEDVLNEAKFRKFSANYFPEMAPANAELKPTEGIIDKAFTVFSHFTDSANSIAIIQCPVEGYSKTALKTTLLHHGGDGEMRFFTCSLAALRKGYNAACKSVSSANLFLASIEACFDYEEVNSSATSKIFVIEDGDKLIEELSAAYDKEDQDKKPVDLFGSNNLMGGQLFGALNGFMKMAAPAAPKTPSNSPEPIEKSELSPIYRSFLDAIIKEKIKLIILKTTTTQTSLEKEIIKMEPSSKEITDWLGNQLISTQNAPEAIQGVAKIFYIIDRFDLTHKVYSQNRTLCKEDIAYQILEKIKAKQESLLDWKTFATLESPLWEEVLFSLTAKVDRSQVSVALKEWGDQVKEKTTRSPTKARDPVEIVRKPLPAQNFMYVIHNIPIAFNDTLAHFNSQLDFKIPLWIAEDDIATLKFRKAQIIAWMRQINRLVEIYDPSQRYTQRPKDDPRVLLVDYFEIKESDASLLQEAMSNNNKIVIFGKKSEIALPSSNGTLSSLGSLANLTQNFTSMLNAPSAIQGSAAASEKSSIMNSFSHDIHFVSEPLSDRERLDFLRYTIATAVGDTAALPEPVLNDFVNVYRYIWQQNGHTTDGIAAIIGIDLSQISNNQKIQDIQRKDIIDFFAIQRNPILKMSRNQITYSIEPAAAPFLYRFWRFITYPIELFIIKTHALITWIYKELTGSLASLFGLGPIFKIFSNLSQAKKAT